MNDINNGHDVLTEQCIVGIALTWPEKIPHILSELNHSDFDSSLAPFVLSIEEMAAQWKKIDAVTLLAHMAGADEAANNQRRQAVLEFVDLVPSASSLDEYIGIVKARSKRRALQAAALEIMSAPPTLDGMAEIVERMVATLNDERRNDCLNMAQMWDLFQDVHDQEEPPKYAKTGLSKLDSRVHISGGLLGILAAYPSGGKTALSIKFALNFAAQSYKIGFFSLETDHEKLIDRVACAASGIRNDIIANNGLTRDGWCQMLRIIKQTSAYDIDWIRASGYTVSQIRERTRARKYDIIFVDYVQIVKPPLSMRNQNRFSVVTDISIALHELAQQTGATVIALSQLVRPEKTAGALPPPPTMSSLRESGQLEQDADFIIAVYDDTMTDKEKAAGCVVPDGAELRMLKVLKNKTGPKNGGFHVVFDGPTQRFTQLAPPRREPEYYQEKIQ